jgi:hypothetical protein
MNRPCGELLYAEIGACAGIFIRDHMWRYSDETTGKLRATKEHTVRRRVAAFRKKEEGGTGRGATRPSPLRSTVPLFKDPCGEVSRSVQDRLTPWCTVGKNGTTHGVRTSVGYARLDCRGVVPLLNDYYEVLCLYLNHFIANKRMIAKTRVGSHLVKKYEPTPRTPYQQVLKRNDVSEEVKATPQEEHATLNLLILKQKLDTLKRNIIRLNHDCGNHV